MSDDLNMAPQLTLTPEADAAAAAAPAAPEASALTLDTAPEAAVQQASVTEAERQKERDDDRSSAAGTAALIGSAKAKEIALSHAAVSADGLRDIAVDLDDKDGAPVYEVEFKSGGYAYDYDIDAKTGKILKNEKEQDD